jgi:hypothetical protein
LQLPQRLLVLARASRMCARSYSAFQARSGLPLASAALGAQAVVERQIGPSVAGVQAADAPQGH